MCQMCYGLSLSFPACPFSNEVGPPHLAGAIVPSPSPSNYVIPTSGFEWSSHRLHHSKPSRQLLQGFQQRFSQSFPPGPSLGPTPAWLAGNHTTSLSGNDVTPSLGNNVTPSLGNDITPSIGNKVTNSGNDVASSFRSHGSLLSGYNVTLSRGDHVTLWHADPDWLGEEFGGLSPPQLPALPVRNPVISAFFVRMWPCVFGLRVRACVCEDEGGVGRRVWLGRMAIWGDFLFCELVLKRKGKSFFGLEGEGETVMKVGEMLRRDGEIESIVGGRGEWDEKG